MHYRLHKTTIETIAERQDSENILTVRIPRSNYVFMVEKQGENKYKTTIFDIFSDKKKILSENNTKTEIDITLQYVMRPQ